MSGPHRCSRFRHLILEFISGLEFETTNGRRSLALSADVATRKRHEDHVEFVMHELSHRSKNLLTVVQSMARQVARQTENLKDFDAAFSTRLRAFADTHDLLVTGGWHGTDIRDLIRTQVMPFVESKENRLIRRTRPHTDSESRGANRLGPARTRNKRRETRSLLRAGGYGEDSMGS
jgi:hypothetical protein